MAEKTFAAFFSYVHDDDIHDNGRITKLRQMLEEEVRALSGEDFEIFQDYEDIHWGQKWEERLHGAIDGSTFLISIVTPRYFRKEFCRKEVLRFLEREKQLGRNNLLLSIYYIDTDLGETDDAVVSAIASHQYFDWRDLRHEPFTNPDVSKRIEKMAREIINAIKLKLKRNPEMSSESPILITADLVTTPEIRKTTKRTEPPKLIVDHMPRRGDYTNISKAIEDAEPGTRILIRPGLYKEAIIMEKPLELIGDGDRNEILIETSEADVIFFNTEFGRVANLTLRQTGNKAYYGVYIAQGRLELEDCDIKSQSLSSVAICRGADPRIRRNQIHHGNESGIYVFDNGKGTLEDNEIYENTLYNVAISTGGNPTMRRNRIYNGKSSGVAFYDNGFGLLEENEIFGNARSGIMIRGLSDPILRRNRIHNGKTSGVFVYDNGKGTLEDNDIVGNGYSGIEIREGGFPIVRRNRINNNNESGVYIHTNGGGLFEYNELRKNADNAWNIDDSSRPNSSGNDNVEE